MQNDKKIVPHDGTLSMNKKGMHLGASRSA